MDKQEFMFDFISYSFLVNRDLLKTCAVSHSRQNQHECLLEQQSRLLLSLENTIAIAKTQVSVRRNYCLSLLWLSTYDVFLLNKVALGEIPVFLFLMVEH